MFCPTFAEMNRLRFGAPARRPLPTAAGDTDAEEEGAAAPAGHAVDVLKLWDSSWYGAQPSQRAARRSGSPRSVAPCDSASPALKPASESSTPSSRDQGNAGPFQPAQAQAAQPQQQPQRDSGASSAAASRPQPSAPVPTSVKAPPEAFAVQLLPGIGTWAARQRLFGRPADLGSLPRSPSASPATPAEGGTPEGKAGGGGNAPVVLAAAAGGAGGAGSPPAAPPQLRRVSSSVKSEQAREAAWRWRFSRKWEAEQKKYYEDPPGAGSLLSNDELDAIQYTQACGMGEHLQFKSPAGSLTPLASAMGSRHSADEPLHHSLSCQFDVSGHGGSLALGALAESASAAGGSEHGGGGGEAARPPRPRPSRGVAPWLSPAGEAPQASATNQVLSMVHKARDLLQKQQQIEAEAQSRWDASLAGGGDTEWAGQHLRPVEIGMSGRFRFVLLRAVDGAGRQRFLVRGRPKATPALLVEDAQNEAASVARQRGLPAVVVETVGGGVMEWREDTDRHLHLSAAPPSGDALAGGSGSRPATSPTKRGPAIGDVTALAASLVRQMLPCHFQVSTTSTPSRLASLMDTLRI